MKVHYLTRNGYYKCNIPLDPFSSRYTIHASQVTCKNCLKVLNKPIVVDEQTKGEKIK